MPISTRIDFLSPLTFVPGFGPRRVAALAESGLKTVGDLLYYPPRRYIDRSTIVPLKETANRVDAVCTVIGTIKRTRVERGRGGGRFRILVEDETGSIEAIWFHGIPYMRASLKTGQRVLMTGKIGFYVHLQMVHPQIETIGGGKTLPDVVFLPQYRLSETMREAGIGQKTMFKGIRWLVENVNHYPQVLPKTIENKKRFEPLDRCIRELHIPSSLATLENFKNRLRYEEVYTTAVTLRLSRGRFNLPGRGLKPGKLVEQFEKNLPFTLTASQHEALGILLDDSERPSRMHRLLQGDVGSGKTVVAFMACLPALNCMYQVAWLAPTEVLAYQTWMKVSAWLEPLGFEAALLTGSTQGRDRQSILADLKTNRLRLVVGTHALIEPAVSFAKLGMVVIDEQHRFGVDQRVAMQDRDPAADFLLLSATPIPQTLAQTLYGDLDVVSITERPAGRLETGTHIVPAAKRGDMERFVLNEIRENNAQAYYVVPRIEPDDGDDDDTGLKDIGTMFDHLTKKTFLGIPSAVVHGRLDAGEKEKIVRGFSSGVIKLLVATTVIEVGIDAPGATIIVIENAERFGLSQLHQLRGRVGRNDKKSYCFLLHEPTADGEAEARLKAFCGEHDGFKIAEMDLQMRGPGQITGAGQAGWDDPRMRLVLDNVELFREVQKEIGELFERRK